MMQKSTGASYIRDATSAPSRRKRTKAWFRLSAVNRLQRARASVPRRRSANRTYLYFSFARMGLFFLNEGTNEGTNDHDTVRGGSR